VRNAPDIFQEAARRLDLEPSACLVVEDAVAGVQTARAAGAGCLGLMTSFSAAQLSTAGADWIAGTLAEARAEVLLG
jgi:beta-phosphoglucomutase-like phosphatase (HAD superfamily)